MLLEKIVLQIGQGTLTVVVFRSDNRDRRLLVLGCHVNVGIRPEIARGEAIVRLRHYRQLKIVSRRVGHWQLLDPLQDPLEQGIPLRHARLAIHASVLAQHPVAVQQTIDIAARQNIHVVAEIHVDRSAVERRVQRTLVRHVSILLRRGDRLENNLMKHVLP